ncbi:restriction endonuclease subunit S [Chryseomicrobium imtechense]
MIEQKSKWFGSIPKEWSVTSLKKAISLAYRYPTYYGIDYVDDGILEVRGEMLRTDGQISLENSSPRYISLETSNRFPLTILEKGDLVISVRGTIGKVGIVDEDIAGSNITANLLRLKIIKKLFVPEYLFWLIRNHVFLAHLNNVSDSTTIKTITLPTFLSIEIPSPTLLVQNKIVKYLNQKVQSIDNIVVQKQNLINLLEQQRQSLITEAVTKGLNPNVKMKDSGVEWIGAIPEHWEVNRISYISRVKARLGWKGLKAEEYVDEGYGFLSTPNIKNREIDFKNINFISEERFLESPEIILEQNDVLLAKDGSTLGIVNIVRELPIPSTVNSSIAVIRPKETITGVYLHYYLKSKPMQDTINQIKGGMGVPHLFQADINKFKVTLPPVYEQYEITNFLDTEILKLEKLVTDIKGQIEKLKEYRQSLIYEAVTGKIDVTEMELEEVR